MFYNINQRNVGETANASFFETNDLTAFSVKLSKQAQVQLLPSRSKSRIKRLLFLGHLVDIHRHSPVVIMLSPPNDSSNKEPGPVGIGRTNDRPTEAPMVAWLDAAAEENYLHLYFQAIVRNNNKFGIMML